MPDLYLVEACQCFPRYRYEQRSNDQRDLLNDAQSLERIDNITDAALRAFRMRYEDGTISKDAIFDYVYGVLHSPVYRERFANDLAKELPRVPFAPDFRCFADAGRRLSVLHLEYETCQEHPLSVESTGAEDLRPEHYRIGTRAMRFADEERTTLTVNDHIRAAGIPAEAHGYHVNGRTPLEWFIDRYRITRDKDSGIVNDPNEWFDDPRDLIASIRRIVHLSVETTRIVADLPEAVGLPETDA